MIWPREDRGKRGGRRGEEQRPVEDSSTSVSSLFPSPTLSLVWCWGWISSGAASGPVTPAGSMLWDCFFYLIFALLWSGCWYGVPKSLVFLPCYGWHMMFIGLQVVKHAAEMLYFPVVKYDLWSVILLGKGSAIAHLVLVYTSLRLVISCCSSWRMLGIDWCWVCHACPLWWLILVSWWTPVQWSNYCCWDVTCRPWV